MKLNKTFQRDGHTLRRNRLSIRDKLAAHALAALDASAEGDHGVGWWHSPERLAERAYSIADAMLEARDG